MLKIQATAVFKRNRKALASDKRYICNEGGSRSSKTYSIVQLLIHYAVTNNNTKITIVSHSLPHLKRGALRDFDNIIREWELYFDEWYNKTDLIYKFPNGSYIEFFGLEDEGKARGSGRDILFCNEANLLSKAVFDQLDMRTKSKVFLDLNPSDFNCWCYEVADGPNAVRIHSTYRDNLRNIPDAMVRVIESYRDADPLMWQVFGLGLRGTSAEQVYTHWRIVDEVPEGEVIYGLDFGYNNPTALVKVTLSDNQIYCEEVLYETKLTTSDLVNKLQHHTISGQVYCDSAEPKTIEELYRHGFNVLPSDKDVTEGIRRVKSLPLYIHRSSANLIREAGSYKWKLDKNGKVMDEPVKDNDHALDALRYAVFTRLKSPAISWGVV